MADLIMRTAKTVASRRCQLIQANTQSTDRTRQVLELVMIEFALSLLIEDDETPTTPQDAR